MEGKRLTISVVQSFDFVVVQNKDPMESEVIGKL